MSSSDTQIQWNLIVSALKQNRLPQAWLLLGPLSFVLNKFTLEAIKLIMCPNKLSNSSQPCLNCSSCQMIGRLEHPDVQWIKPEKNRRSY